MTRASVKAMTAALEQAGVRYLVAGGLVQTPEGLDRIGDEIEIAVRLDWDNIVALFGALTGLGYRPIIPLLKDRLPSRSQFEHWVREHGVKVVNFHNEKHSLIPLNVYVLESADFDVESGNAPGPHPGFVSGPTAARLRRGSSREPELNEGEKLLWTLNAQDRRGDHE